MKGDGHIYILKRFSNLQALSVKLVEFIYLLAVTVGINRRQKSIDEGEAS